MDDPLGYFIPWLLGAALSAILPVGLWVGFRRWFAKNVWHQWLASGLVGFAIAPSIFAFGCCSGSDEFLIPAWCWIWIIFSSSGQDGLGALLTFVIAPVAVTTLLIFGVVSFVQRRGIKHSPSPVPSP